MKTLLWCVWAHHQLRMIHEQEVPSQRLKKNYEVLHSALKERTISSNHCRKLTSGQWLLWLFKHKNHCGHGLIRPVIRFTNDSSWISLTWPASSTSFWWCHHYVHRNVKFIHFCRKGNYADGAKTASQNKKSWLEIMAVCGSKTFVFTSLFLNNPSFCSWELFACRNQIVIYVLLFHFFVNCDVFFFLLNAIFLFCFCYLEFE